MFESWLPCNDAPPGRVLVASLDRLWLGAAFARRGHTVRYAATADTTLQLLDEEDPDLLVIDAGLPDAQALALCHTLRGAVVDDRPVVVAGPAGLPEADHLAFLRAGAWDVHSAGDANETLAAVIRLETLMRARARLVRERREGLTDPTTGLYNRLGLGRRAREVGAQARRTRDPVACVVFRLDPADGSESAMRSCSRIFQEQARGCDAVARLGAFQIAVLAPGTNAAGAAALARRIAYAVRADQAAGGNGHGLKFTAVYNSASNREETPVDPLDLVTSAAAALRTTPLPPAGPWLFGSGPPARNTGAPGR